MDLFTLLDQVHLEIQCILAKRSLAFSAAGLSGHLLPSRFCVTRAAVAAVLQL